MKRLICFLIVIMLVPCGANSATVRFDAYSNILGSALTANDELQVWNNGNIRNITVDNLWSYYTGKNTYQPLDSDLTYLAGVTLSNDIKTFLSTASAAPAASALGLGTGDNPSFNSVHASGGNLAAANKQVVKAWQTGLSYVTQETAAVHGGKIYICTSSHTAGSTTEPGVGVDWATVWAEVQGAGDGSLTDIDDLPGDTVDDNLIDVGLIADLGPMIHGKTSKTTPVDSDELPIVDSEASNVLKKLTWVNLKTALASVFQSSMTTASQAEMEAGTESALRAMSPLRIFQAIAAWNMTGHAQIIDNAAGFDPSATDYKFGYDSTLNAFKMGDEDGAGVKIWYPGQASPTSGRIVAWGTNQLVDGPAIGTTAGTVAAGDHTHSGYLATGGDLDSLEAGITGIVKGSGNGGGYSAATRSDYATASNLGSFSSPVTDNPYTLTAANSYASVIYYGATGTINLPAGASGMNIIIYNTGAFTVTIDPNGSEVIVREGTAQTGGVSITLASGAGNFVSLHWDSAKWITLGSKGTLAQGS